MADIVGAPNGAHEPIKKLCFEGVWAYAIEIVFWCCVALLIMYLLRRLIQGPSYHKANRIDGKVVIITGCNTGIGKQTAMELARRGARLYMACRDAARCEAARLEIIEKTQNPNIFNRTLDLSSLSSVRQFAERFKAEETKLDLLINNAGVMAIPRKLTADGFEQQFGINHLGHFLLTNLLVDRLKAAAPSRIINVSSLAYIFGRINREDLMGEKNYKRFFGAYAQSKLANILFTNKLAELLKDSQITANCLHPGLVRTELWRHNTSPRLWKAVRFLLNFAFKTPKAGAQTTIFLALEPKLECVSGGYYYNLLRLPLLSKAKDIETADWLWQESEKLVGLKPTMVAKREETNGGVGEMESVKVVVKDDGI